MDVPADFGYISVDQIRPNPDQPRKNFEGEELASLAESIKELGVLNPVVVRGPYPDGGHPYYILIDGERRLRATKLAGLRTIPAYVKEMDEHLQSKVNLEMALVANLQRSDMNPIEEAKAYKKLLDNGHTIRSVAELTGRSTGSINIRTKLLTMEEEIQQFYAREMLPLDPSSVYAISNLPEAIRINIATKLAARHASTQSIRMICTRLTNNYDRPKNRKYNIKKSIPSIEISELADSPSLKALSAAGKLPPWNALLTAAQETCTHCVLADCASDANCKDCPLINFLKFVVKTAESGLK